MNSDNMPPPVPQGPYMRMFAETVDEYRQVGDDECIEIVEEGDSKKSKNKSGKDKSSSDPEPIEMSLHAWTFKKAQDPGSSTKPTWEYALKKALPFSTEQLEQELRKYDKKLAETPVKAYNALTPFQQKQMDRHLTKTKDKETNPNAAWSLANIRKDRNPNKEKETITIYLVLRRQDKRKLKPHDAPKVLKVTSQYKPVFVGEEVENIYEPLQNLSINRDNSEIAKKPKREKSSAKQSQESIPMAPDPPYIQTGPTVHPTIQTPVYPVLQPPAPVPQAYAYSPGGAPQDPWPSFAPPAENPGIYVRQNPATPMREHVTNPFAPGYSGAPVFGTPIITPDVHPPRIHEPGPLSSPPYPSGPGFADQGRVNAMPEAVYERRPEQHHPNQDRNQPMHYDEKFHYWDDAASHGGATDSDHWRDQSSNEGAGYPSTPGTSMSPEPYPGAWPQEKGYHAKYGHHGRKDSGYQTAAPPGPTIHPVRTSRRDSGRLKQPAPAQHKYTPQVHQQNQTRPRPHSRNNNDHAAYRKPDRYDNGRDRDNRRLSPPITSTSSPSSSPSRGSRSDKTSSTLSRLVARLDNMERRELEERERERVEEQRREAYERGRADERWEREREMQRPPPALPPLLHSQVGGGGGRRYGGVAQQQGYGGGGGRNAGGRAY